MNINTLNRTLVLLKRLFDTSVSTNSFITTNFQKPSARYTLVQQPFQRVTPESQGIPSDTILSFLEELESNKDLEIQNLLILRNGKILYENSFHNSDLNLWKATYSQCKTITGLAIGILRDMGKLELSHKVVNILGDAVPLSQRLKFKNLTVEHLLTMTSAANFNEASSMTSEDWVKSFFMAGTSGEPGKIFSYNSLNTYILSNIVTAITGESLSHFLEQHLFSPMGISEYFWETCPKGVEKGGWGLYMKPEDMAKLGQLILNKGKWNNMQLISREWINLTTCSHCTTPREYGRYDYGYHIWTDPQNKAFLFNGMVGQNVLGFKNTNILIVSNGAIPELFQQSSFYNTACKYFAGDFPVFLPESPAYDKLRTRGDILHPNRREFLQAFRPLEGKIFVASHSPSVGLLPVFLQIIQNNYTKGTRAVSFYKKEGQPFITYFEEDQEYAFPIGFGKPLSTEIEFHSEPYRIVTQGDFREDEDGLQVFKITINFTETPCTRVLKIYHNKNSLDIKFFETPGTDLLIQGAKTFKGSILNKPLIGSTLAKLDYDYVEYKIYKLLQPVVKFIEKE